VTDELPKNNCVIELICYWPAKFQVYMFCCFGETIFHEGEDSERVGVSIQKLDSPDKVCAWELKNHSLDNKHLGTSFHWELGMYFRYNDVHSPYYGLVMKQ